MNDYEMVVLYHPDLEIDLDKALKKVEKIVKDNKGKIVDSDNWGKRKLAYTINKQDHAIYVFYNVQLEGESISKIEQTFNITDEVLRYLIVKPGPEIEESDDKDAESKDKKPAAKKEEEKEVKDETKEAKVTTKKEE